MDLWLNYCEEYGVKKNSYHKIESIDELPDGLLFKHYLEENPSESMYDFEEKQIKLQKFFFRSMPGLHPSFYCEIEARAANVLTKDNDERLIHRKLENRDKGKKFFIRYVEANSDYRNLPIKDMLLDGRGNLFTKYAIICMGND